MNKTKRDISQTSPWDKQEFIPLLLGGDINTYSMARAFYEQYQVKSYIIGKYPTGPSCNSRIIEYHADPGIDSDEQFLSIINTFARAYAHKKILLIGCGDNYVARISRYYHNKNHGQSFTNAMQSQSYQKVMQIQDCYTEASSQPLAALPAQSQIPQNSIPARSQKSPPAPILPSEHSLAPNILTPTTDYELMQHLQNKETFYQLCRDHNLPYPRTLVYRSTMKTDFKLPFPFPVILKPSDGISYWEHPFAGQNKVYQIENRHELETVIWKIYHAGYQGTLIIQDRIPGNDEYMRVLTSYSDRRGKVKMMCLGHVLLEEHTPHGKGNHAVILTEQNEALLKQAKAFLESIHYTGFANFDIKFDQRDQTYRFFEINTRQGRSNYYVTASGLNMAKYPAEEYIYQRELEFEQPQKEHLWLVVPKAVAFRYIKDPANLAKMRSLFRQNQSVNPIFQKGDLKPKRFLAMAKNYFSHFIKFRKYYQCEHTDRRDSN